MAGLVRMSLDSPEETRPFEGGTGQLQLVDMKEGGVGRATFLPGWRWSLHVRPIAQTDSCQAAHMGRDPAKSFMRPEAAVACAAGRGRGGGWRRLCSSGRRCAAG